MNKKYFDRAAVYCESCRTGSCQPFFPKDVLADYYREFYWRNRDANEGRHVAGNSRPNDEQIGLARDRIAWMARYVGGFTSVIDFGAGDCAASYLFSVEGKLDRVHVVDPSQRARLCAEKYRLTYSEELATAPVVDLIYSAHAIEHVHDLRAVVSELLSKTVPGGHIFLETPNIGDVELFQTLSHTPHTFMLSQATFRWIESLFPVRVIAAECCGPPWKRHFTRIRSDEKADLRVLMRKTTGT